MKLVAVTRIRNEDDIVEAFARHHAQLVDHHVFLDNDSSDRTLDVLKSLRAEGLSLSLFASASTTLAEAAQNTLLLRHAVSLGADWVVPLDCDEFLDPRAMEGTLHEVLASLPAQAPCAEMSGVNYHPTSQDDASEPIVPLRLRLRERQAGGFLKVIVRARTAAIGATLAAGNHEALHNGMAVPAIRDPRLVFGHYYMRSGWQILAKAVVGRLKLYAGGQAMITENIGVHYAHIFENLRDHPQWLLDDAAFLAGTRPREFYDAESVIDPIHYLGGPLGHTQPADPRLKAVSSIIACAEIVARRHGDLADATPLTRRMVDDAGAEFRPIP